MEPRAYDPSSLIVGVVGFIECVPVEMGLRMVELEKLRAGTGDIGSGEALRYTRSSANRIALPNPWPFSREDSIVEVLVKESLEE